MDEQFTTPPQTQEVPQSQPEAVQMPTEPVVQTQHHVQKVMPQKNSSPLLAILFTAVIFGGGGYYLAKYVPSLNFTSPTPTPTVAVETPTPSPSPTAAPAATPVTYSAWSTSEIPELKMKFQYPSGMKALGDVYNTTALAGDNEYWVTTPGAGDSGLYLQMYLYNSTKDVSSWWDTEGTAMFRKNADEMEEAFTSDATITLDYKTKPSSVDGKEAVDLVITSNSSDKDLQSVKYATIFQHNGYIVMAMYQATGDIVADGDASLELSRKIISTFDFND